MSDKVGLNVNNGATLALADTGSVKDPVLKPLLEGGASASIDEINAKLTNLFADSPYFVVAEQEGNQIAYYFNWKDKDAQGTPIKLASSDIEHTLQIYKGLDQNVLLIPLQSSDWAKATYNNDLSVVDLKGTNKKCQYASFVAIGVKGNVGGSVFLDGKKYIASPINEWPFKDLRPLKEGHKQFDRNSPATTLVEITCAGGEATPENSKTKTPPAIEPKFGREPVISNKPFVYDLTGSSGLFSPELQQNNLVQLFTFYTVIRAGEAKDKYVDAACEKRFHGFCEREVNNALLKNDTRFVLPVEFMINGKKVQKNINLSLCELVGCGSGQTADPRNAIQEGIRQLYALKDEVLKEEDTSSESGIDPIALATNEDTNGVAFVGQFPLGKSAGRELPKFCAKLYSNKICTELIDKEALLGWSLKEKLPLFISMGLVPTDNHSSLTLEAAVATLTYKNASDKDIDNAIRVIYARANKKERDASIKALFDLALNGQRDRNVSGNATALLCAWALKGDKIATDLVLELFERAKELGSEEAKTVIARTTSLLIDDAKAQKILAKVKENPTAGINSILVAALAGRKEYAEALGIILNESFNLDMFAMEKTPSILEATGRTFIDPSTEMPKLLKGLTREDREMLVGAKWPDAEFQRIVAILGKYQKRSIAQTEASTDSIQQVVVQSARIVNNPTLVEKNDLVVNTSLRERFFYKTMTMNDFESQGIALAKQKGGLEEHYTATKLQDRFAAIETGYLESEGSVFISSPNNEEYQMLLAELDGLDDKNNPVTLIDYHIHPVGNEKRHALALVAPSDTDLNTYFRTAIEWRQMFPEAKMEFRIMTPSGVLVLKPNKDFYKMVDRSIKKARDGEAARKATGEIVTNTRTDEGLIIAATDGDYQNMIEWYNSQSEASGCQFMPYQLKWLLEKAFEVELIEDPNKE